MGKGFVYPNQVINAWMDRLEHTLSDVSLRGRDVVTRVASVEEVVDGIVNPPPEPPAYTAPSVSLSGGQTLELGQVVANPTITWSVSVMTGHAIATQTLTDLGAVTPLSASGSHVFTGANVSSNKTYTMTVSDNVVGGEGGQSRSGSTSFTFRQKRHWGTAAAGVLDPAGILALQGDEFSTSRVQTRYFNPSNEYIWFAWPASLGGDTSIFVVNNLPNTSWVIADITHTNASGGVSTYRTIRSTYKQSGVNIKVEVS
jgi:hypothetical protein